MRIEIAANSLASALAAQDGGADRIELCSALELGGLTPSRALIECARERIRLPLYVLIRPRAGDFVYDDLECEVMARDIALCRDCGCDGIVVGALAAGGGVDLARSRDLIAAAGTLGVTFHRAFDLAGDPLRALEDVIGLGCERVLTSGGRASALAGTAAIARLVIAASGRVAIMPGAGIDAENIVRIRAETGATEFHASARRQLPSRQAFASDELADMALGELRTDVDQVRALVSAARNMR